MARKKKKAKDGTNRGVDPIQIDWSEFDKLCGLQATLREIAGWFSCSPDTIERACQEEKGMSFADYSDQRRQPGKVSLRRRQYEVAMKGNVVMLIWLGKQWLEQTDKVHNTGDDGDIHLNVNLSGAEPNAPDPSKPRGPDPTAA